MRAITKKFLSLTLVFCMMTAFMPVFSIQVGAKNTNVSFTAGQTEAVIEAAIQSKIDTAKSGDTITVTGSKTMATGIDLKIPQGVKVIWKATFAGDDDPQIWIEGVSGKGAGEFEIAIGADIVGACGVSGEDVTIIVSGGTVVATTYEAIWSHIGDVIVTGGKLSGTNSSGGCGICADDGNITISGGIVEANGDNSSAIVAAKSAKITGGKVQAKGTGGKAIYAYDGGVVAYLKGLCIGGFEVNLDDGLIVEVDSLSIPTTRNGKSTGITKKAGTGTVVWNCTGKKPVINFTIGANKPKIEWGMLGKVNPFTDVKTTDWFYEGVMYIYNKKITEGTSATKYSPNAGLSRQAFVTFMWRVHGKPKVTNSTPFKDVTTKGDMGQAIKWAYKNGIINGTSKTKFSPKATLTRQALATMLYRYETKFKKNPKEVNSAVSFADKSKIASYAKTSMDKCYKQDLLRLTGSNIRPTAKATRGEMAYALHRFMVGIGK